MHSLSHPHILVSFAPIHTFAVAVVVVVMPTTEREKKTETNQEACSSKIVHPLHAFLLFSSFFYMDPCSLFK